MSQKTRTLRRIPQTTLRRLRNIPTYFFLIWRWTWWFFALAWILLSQQKPTPLPPMVFLGITFIQSLVVTFYTPVFKIFLPELPWKKRNGASTPRQRNESRTKREWRNIWERNRVRPIAVDEEPETLPALVRSTNPYKDLSIAPGQVVSLVLHLPRLVERDCVPICCATLASFATHYVVLAYSPRSFFSREVREEIF